MTNLAFKALLDAYCRAKVDYELCHMNGYDKKLHRLNVISGKLMEVYYSSNLKNNYLNFEKLRKLRRLQENEKATTNK